MFSQVTKKSNAGKLDGVWIPSAASHRTGSSLVGSSETRFFVYRSGQKYVARAGRNQIWLLLTFTYVFSTTRFRASASPCFFLSVLFTFHFLSFILVFSSFSFLLPFLFVVFWSSVLKRGDSTGDRNMHETGAKIEAKNTVSCF